MKQYMSNEPLGWFAYAIACLIIYAQLKNVSGMLRLAGSKVIPVASELQLPISVQKLTSGITKPINLVLRDERVLRLPAYQDPTSQKLLNHLMDSWKYNELQFVQNLDSIEKAQRQSHLDSAESKILKNLRSRGMDEIPEHAIRLQLWGKYSKIDWESLSISESEDRVNELIIKMKEDIKRAKELAKRYANAISDGNFGVIMDNEADDLLFLIMCFEEGIFPKFIIVYGGFTELRYESVLEFVRLAGEHYHRSPDEMPTVYKGFPHPYEPDQARHPYDYEEGTGFIDEDRRLELIKRSQALEKELKDPSGQTWTSEAWDHPVFRDGLDAMRRMIDGSEYSAIAVLTCPAPLTHVIEESPDRARRVGVTMSSPYSYAMNEEEGVRYTPAYNARRQLPMMNKLLNSGVDFIGVGGGTARTVGMRTIHDYIHGSRAGNLYSEEGLKHLEEVITPHSVYPIFRIVAHAGLNVASGKWRDWDEMFGSLWKFLEIEEPHRPGLEQLRRRPQYVSELLAQEKEQREKSLARSTGSKEREEEKGQEKDQVQVPGGMGLKETETEMDKAPSAMESKEMEKEMEKAPSAMGSKETEKEKEKEKEQVPSAATWELDMMMTLMRIWYHYGNELRWQAPSADLHAMITTRSKYHDGILGAVRYESKEWPEVAEEDDKKVKVEKLDRLINSDEGHHYSISDMKYGLIIDRLQGLLNRYHEKAQEMSRQGSRRRSLL